MDKKNLEEMTYGIEHLNSHDRTAMKNHYLLTQIADIIMQLYVAWNPAVKETGQSKKIHLQGYWKVFDDKR